MLGRFLALQPLEISAAPMKNVKAKCAGIFVR
jgi:hypothetical protein